MKHIAFQQAFNAFCRHDARTKGVDNKKQLDNQKKQQQQFSKLKSKSKK